jgi:hypothetical protein
MGGAMSVETVYYVQLQVLHPELLAKDISDGLDLHPEGAFDRGHRMPPYGSGEPVGTYKKTVWYSGRRVEAQRLFTSDVIKLVNWLESKKAFVAVLTERGTVTINIHLGGLRNIGDVLEPTLLARLAALGVCLGIEVYPEL